MNIRTLAQISGFTDGHGYHPTFHSGVSLFGANRHEASCPQMYGAGMVFILQGKKVGAAQGIQFETHSERFLLMTNSYPVTCETLATGDEPMLGIYVELDKAELARQLDILAQASATTSQTIEHIQSILSIKLSTRIRDCLDQLIEVLHNQAEAQILADGILKRLLYEVLQSEARSMLMALGNHDHSLARVSKVMNYIEDHLSDKLSVDELAEYLGMSPTAFHKRFKEAAGDTPLQYIKKMRLTKARTLMVYQNQSALQAALNVGYESPNQFSREFKRFFGVPPSQARQLPYSNLSGVG